MTSAYKVKTTLAEIDDAEEKRLRSMLKKDYREDLREYKEKHKASGLMRTKKTVSSLLLLRQNLVHDILLQLKQRFMK